MVKTKKKSLTKKLRRTTKQEEPTLLGRIMIALLAMPQKKMKKQSCVQ